MPKHTQSADYYHRSSLANPGRARQRVLARRAEKLAGTTAWDVLKVRRDGCRVSLLRYPGFLRETNPKLAGGVVANLCTGTVRRVPRIRGAVIHRRRLMLSGVR